MKTFKQLVEEYSKRVNELYPWDLAERLQHEAILIVDVREPYEYHALHIPGSINVPRGILESACDYGYEETVPELVAARTKTIVVVCRSGYRSVFAADTMQQMGYQHVWSLTTGLRGWNDSEQPLIDKANVPVDVDLADDYFTTKLRPEQHKPN